MSDERLEQALNDLVATTETARLTAARAILDLMGELSPRIDAGVREALARESVPWVRAVMLQILAKSGPALETGILVSAPSWDEQLNSVDMDVARQVVNMSTTRVLHEVSAVVGRAKLAARAELSGDYRGSETVRQLEFLSEVCAGLRTLASATQSPTLAEFDLSQELGELARAVSEERICPILASGPAPYIVVSDRGLLCLAVRNILLNAVEATVSVGPADESRAIVLTWGSSPGGSHATVIDRGPGPPQFLVATRSAGVSTKEGHPGYGLATASEAMRSLRGAVKIQRNDRGGATVVLSWADGSE
jgi:signal transduction histidine kinase